MNNKDNINDNLGQQILFLLDGQNLNDQELCLDVYGQINPVYKRSIEHEIKSLVRMGLCETYLPFAGDGEMYLTFPQIKLTKTGRERVKELKKENPEVSKIELLIEEIKADFKELLTEIQQKNDIRIKKLETEIKNLKKNKLLKKN